MIILEEIAKSTNSKERDSHRTEPQKGGGEENEDPPNQARSAVAFFKYVDCLDKFVTQEEPI